MNVLSMLLDVAAAFVRLLAAEGRVAKRAVIGVGWALACIGIACVLLLGAVGIFLAATYQYLVMQMSPATALLVVSLLAFVLAMVFAGIAKWRAS